MAACCKISRVYLILKFVFVLYFACPSSVTAVKPLARKSRHKRLPSTHDWQAVCNYFARGGSRSGATRQSATCGDSNRREWWQRANSICRPCNEHTASSLIDVCRNPPVQVFHMSLDTTFPRSWTGNLLVIKAFLLTQDLRHARLILWVTSMEDIERVPEAAALLRYVDTNTDKLRQPAPVYVLNCDGTPGLMDEEMHVASGIGWAFSRVIEVHRLWYFELLWDTALQNHTYFGNPTALGSHLPSGPYHEVLRLLVLLKYGGTFLDAGALLTQDLGALLSRVGYQWAVEWLHSSDYLVTLKQKGRLVSAMVDVLAALPEDQEGVLASLNEQCARVNSSRLHQAFGALQEDSRRLLVHLLRHCIPQIAVQRIAMSTAELKEHQLRMLPVTWFDPTQDSCLVDRVVQSKLARRTPVYTEPVGPPVGPLTGGLGPVVAGMATVPGPVMAFNVSDKTPGAGGQLSAEGSESNSSAFDNGVGMRRSRNRTLITVDDGQAAIVLPDKLPPWMFKGPSPSNEESVLESNSSPQAAAGAQRHGGWLQGPGQSRAVAWSLRGLTKFQKAAGQYLAARLWYQDLAPEASEQPRSILLAVYEAAVEGFFAKCAEWDCMPLQSVPLHSLFKEATLAGSQAGPKIVMGLD